MNFKKQLGAAFAVLSLTSGLIAPLALAADPATPPTGGSTLSGALSGGLDQAVPAPLKGGKDLNKIIGNLINAVIGFLGVLLFVYLLYGGFLYMTAAGDANQVKKAIDVIRSAIIGLVIISLAYAISTYVVTQLGNAVADVKEGG